VSVEDDLAEVAGELSWLDPPPVFIGGATIGLFIDAFGRSQLRTTKDVDCIAPAVTTQSAWFDLERALRHRHWVPVMEGPICRYRSPSGHTVDILAVTPEVQGFAGRWFPGAVGHATSRLLGSGVAIRVPEVPWLLACKLDAFHDRGRADPLASVDFEDVVAILDGCRDVETQVAAADTDVREFLAAWCSGVLADATLLEAGEGHLPRGGDDADRRRRLRRRLTALARGGTASPSPEGTEP
jgi:hypothetical protein